MEQRCELEERLVDPGALEAPHAVRASLGGRRTAPDLAPVERSEGAALVVARVEVASLGALLLERVDRQHCAYAAAARLGEEHLHRERTGELVGDGEPAIGELGEVIAPAHLDVRILAGVGALRTEKVLGPLGAAAAVPRPAA